MQKAAPIAESGLWAGLATFPTNVRATLARVDGDVIAAPCWPFHSAIQARLGFLTLSYHPRMVPKTADGRLRLCRMVRAAITSMVEVGDVAVRITGPPSGNLPFKAFRPISKNATNIQTEKRPVGVASPDVELILDIKSQSTWMNTCAHKAGQI